MYFDSMASYKYSSVMIQTDNMASRFQGHASSMYDTDV